MSLEPGHHRHRAGGRRAPPSSPARNKKRSVFGSEKRKGKRDIKNPNPRRKLGEEEQN